MKKNLKIVEKSNKPATAPSIGPLQEVFAKNVARLLDVLEMDRKEAADLLGVPYKWLWRMATKGITRTDDRHRSNLQKVADYFFVADVNRFWQPGLLYWLITSEEGKPFRNQFRANLKRLYLKENDKKLSVDHELIAATEKATDIVLVASGTRCKEEPPAMTHSEKLEALIDTGKHDELKQMADAFAALVEKTYQADFVAKVKRATGTFDINRDDLRKTNP